MTNRIYLLRMDFGKYILEKNILPFRDKSKLIYIIIFQIIQFFLHDDGFFHFFYKEYTYRKKIVLYFIIKSFLLLANFSLFFFLYNDFKYVQKYTNLPIRQRLFIVLELENFKTELNFIFGKCRI